VSEDFTNSLAFIIGAVSSLSDFLEDDILDLGQALSVNSNGCAFEAPGLQDGCDEIVLFVDWGDGIAVSIEVDEGLL
jgi:hypothetical protein